MFITAHAVDTTYPVKINPDSISAIGREWKGCRIFITDKLSFWVEESHSEIDSLIDEVRGKNKTQKGEINGNKKSV